MTLSRLDDGELGGTPATGLRDKFRAMGDDRLPGIGSSAVAGIRALRKSQSNQPNRGPG